MWTLIPCGATATGQACWRRRLNALPLEAVVAQIAALEAGELLALGRHLRPRRVPGAAAAAVVERSVQRAAGALLTAHAMCSADAGSRS